MFQDFVKDMETEKWPTDSRGKWRGDYLPLPDEATYQVLAVCVYVCLFVCVCVYVCAYMYIYVCVRVCVCVCVCVYIYI